MKRKTYPKYKASGVEWLGDIPEHWNIERIGYSTYVKGRIGWHGLTADEFVDEGPYCVTGTDFIEGRVNWKTCYHVSLERYEEDHYIHLHEGDLLMTKDGTIGKLAIVRDLQGKATLNSGIFLIRPLNKSYLTEFMYWMLNSKAFAYFIEFSKTGTTISHLYQNAFARFIFPLPPLSEQQAIASFLDRETEQMNLLISKKKRLIELLKEKRTAVISCAVTKGIDAFAKMKPSGVEWIGDIPEHWKVKKMKWITESIVIGDWISPENIYPNEEYPVFGGNGIIGYTNDYNSEGKDIIIGRVGTKCGNVYLIEGKKWISDKALKIKITNNSIKKKYLTLLLFSMNLNKLANQNAQPLITGSVIGDQFLPLPPLSEQRSIVDFLDKETKQIDTLIDKIETTIGKLNEYRISLISAVVTGKIDIRETLYRKEKTT